MVRFLIDANLPRATGDLVRSCGYEAVDVRDIGLGSAPDETVATWAKKQGMCLLTRDTDFGNVLLYPPQEYAGIIVLQTPPDARRAIVLHMIESFLQNTEILGQLPGHLAIVDLHSIRLRPA
jgi:predicted nuclease of predicted toxin-antitoxin system